MKKTDLAYIAGLIDGEGCIHATTVKYAGRASAIQVTITTTYKPVLEFVQSIFGGKIYNNQTRDKPFWKPIYRWTIYGEKAIPVLQSVKPFLIIKRGQAEIALRILASRRFHSRYTPMEKFLREADALAMRELNR